jgi:flagellar motility protein MotE (MotC chaperone)
MKIVFFIIIQVVIMGTTFAAKESKGTVEEEKLESKSKDNSEKKRLYTEEEFQKSVMQEVEKHLKKVGSTKIINFSKELIKKEYDIKLHELKITKSEERLKMNEKNFQQQVVKFRSKQNKFIGCIDAKQKNRDKRVGHMVDVISGMKPANAASLLSVQDAIISVQILEKLDPVKVSKIFNLLDKEISARLQKQYMNMKR